jgi:plastocyanin
MTRRVLPLLLVLAASVLALSACGGSESSATTAATTGGGGGGGGSTVEISADPSGALAYEQTDVSATAGSITIDFTNMSSVPHNVMIEGSDSGTDTITSSSTTATVDLEPGTYTFFCSVDGHRAAGMEGTLTVN